MRKIILVLFMTIFISASAFAGESIIYTVDGLDYEGYMTSPAENAPLVILLHDWDGLTDYEVKRAEMLAELGYAVFAADLFGKGVRPTEVKDKRQHTGELYKDREKMRKLIQSGVNTAKERGLNTTNSVIMGYCFGGAAVLEYARSGADIKGDVTFHGGSKAKGKVLVLHGTADANITMDDFANLAKELEQHAVNHEMITYSGAPHAFTVFGSDRYREDADRKSWDRFLAFLKETL